MNLTLRDARKRADLTQDELATRSGVDQTTISSLETFRHTNPTLETIQKLADALGVAPARLVFIREDRRTRSRRKEDSAIREPQHSETEVAS